MRRTRVEIPKVAAGLIGCSAELVRLRYRRGECVGEKGLASGIRVKLHRSRLGVWSLVRRR